MLPPPIKKKKGGEGKDKFTVQTRSAATLFTVYQRWQHGFENTNIALLLFSYFCGILHTPISVHLEAVRGRSVLSLPTASWIQADTDTAAPPHRYSALVTIRGV